MLRRERSAKDRIGAGTYIRPLVAESFGWINFLLKERNTASSYLFKSSGWRLRRNPENLYSYEVLPCRARPCPIGKVPEKLLF